MDIGGLSRILFAFFIVVGFIGIAAMLARRTGLAAGAKAFARERRLALVDSLAIDARRRAVIIRCDGREHLILLGQTGETFIEGNIPPRSAAETGEAPAESLANLAKEAAVRPFRRCRAASAANSAVGTKAPSRDDREKSGAGGRRRWVDRLCSDHVRDRPGAIPGRSFESPQFFGPTNLPRAHAVPQRPSSGPWDPTVGEPGVSANSLKTQKKSSFAGSTEMPL